MLSVLINTHLLHVAAKSTHEALLFWLDACVYNADKQRDPVHRAGRVRRVSRDASN